MDFFIFIQLESVQSGSKKKASRTLAPGKLADFVVLNGDLRKVNPVDIKDITVLETYVGGKQVFVLEDN